MIIRTSAKIIINSQIFVFQLAEHDIFGEAVSDSEDDDEEAHINVMELDENSRLSVDSRVSDSNSMRVGYSEQSANVPSTSNGPLVTEFSKEMFESEETIEEIIETEDVKIPKQEMLDAYEMSESYSESQNIMINKGKILDFFQLKVLLNYRSLTKFSNFFHRFHPSSTRAIAERTRETARAKATTRRRHCKYRKHETARTFPRNNRQFPGTRSAKNTRGRICRVKVE